jgi:hypothetical protein
MPRSWANAESTKYRALLAGPLFFPWTCTRAKNKPFELVVSDLYFILINIIYPKQQKNC